MTDTPSRADIETFIEALDEGATDPWEPVSWREVDDPEKDSYRVMVAFQYDAEPHQTRRFGPDKHDGRSDHAIVLDTVRRFEDATEAGAPREQVIRAAEDESVSNPDAILLELVNRGEVYELREDYLRTV